jgi:hypothetical protein
MERLHLGSRGLKTDIRAPLLIRPFPILLGLVLLSVVLPLPASAQTPRPATTATPTPARGTPTPTVQPAANPAPSPLPIVPNPDPWFGAVQAIYAPEAAFNAGVSWQRLIFPWSEIQPQNTNQIEAGWFSDAQIAAQRALGFEIVGITLYTPTWAARNSGFGARSVPAGLQLPIDHPQNYWASYVKQLVSKYRGRIDTWVFYNEPDLFNGNDFRTFAGSPADYAQLLKVGYLAAKSVNPDVKIVMAGLTYWWDKEHDRPQYLQHVLDAITADPTARANNFFFDAVDVHAYSNPLNSYLEPTLFRRILQSKGMDKPIWITESGVLPKDDPRVGITDGPFRATLDEQASYVIQSMALARAAGVARYSLYKMQDEFPENGDEYWGLTRNDGTVRPAYLAYQVAARYFQGVEKATYYWAGAQSPPTEEEIGAVLASNAGRFQWPWPAAVNLVVLERKTDRITVVWNASPDPLEVAVHAEAPRGTLVDKFGRTSDIAASNGAYSVRLDPTRNNSDPRDATLYLVGGNPWIIVEDRALIDGSALSPPTVAPDLPSEVAEADGTEASPAE